MKRVTLFCMIFFLSLRIGALQLPEIIGDNMMLQQKSDARLWGWAKAGSKVTVTTSWNKKKYTAKASDEGKWTLQVKTPAASYETYSITIKGDGETRVLQNVLIGEVWFCSGQSNMEMPLCGFWNCPVEGGNEAIAQSGKYKHAIRVATIQRCGAQEPQDSVPGKWKVCLPENAERFTACGYFFARTLTDLLDIPVGIINCSYGGSAVEGWLPKEILLTYPDGLTPMDDTDYHAKMVMYNAMLHPLIGYTIKGFLWNQGETNVGHEKEYIDRFQTMTELWRKLWNQPGDKLPMYTVELPPFGYGRGYYNNDWGAKFREAQHIIAHQLPNSGCVCTNDLAYEYEPEQIHGSKKLEIGQRLAYMAATRDYGIKGIYAECPEFSSMEITDASAQDQSVIAGTALGQNPNNKGKVVKLYFSNANDGFNRLENIPGFEAAGTDGVFHPAIVWATSEFTSTHSGCLLKLVCPEVPDVAHVRYNFKNWAPGVLKSNMGLPVVPFRTDK